MVRGGEGGVCVDCIGCCVAYCFWCCIVIVDAANVKQRGNHECERGCYVCCHHLMPFMNCFFFLLLRVLASHHLVFVLVAPEMPGLSGSLGLDA